MVGSCSFPCVTDFTMRGDAMIAGFEQHFITNSATFQEMLQLGRHGYGAKWETVEGG